MNVLGFIAYIDFKIKNFYTAHKYAGIPLKAENFSAVLVSNKYENDLI